MVTTDTASTKEDQPQQPSQPKTKFLEGSDIAKALLTIAVSAVTAYLTYVVKEGTEREKPIVEYAEVHFDRDSYFIDGRTIRALLDPHVNGLRSEFDLWLDREPENVRGDLSDRSGRWFTEEGCAELVERLNDFGSEALTGRIQELTEFERSWRTEWPKLQELALRIQQNNSPQEIIRRLATKDLIPATATSTRGSPDDISEFLTKSSIFINSARSLNIILEEREPMLDLQNINQSLPRILQRCKMEEEIRARIINEAKAFRSHRTGSGRIVLSFANKGGRDALLKTKATLKIGKDVTIPVQLDADSPRVLPHGAATSVQFTFPAGKDSHVNQDKILKATTQSTNARLEYETVQRGAYHYDLPFVEAD